MSTEQYLTVPSAELCYEVQGTGPYLICVPGANGDAGIFKPFRSQIDKYFTVVLYDRRGFSRSKLTGEQDYTQRLETDVDDIYRLMTHLTKDKFFVFGNSSGAIVSLKYVSTHPETVKKCFAHEPPLMCICPNKDELRGFQQGLVNLYREKGKAAAMEVFINAMIGGPDKKDAKTMMASQSAHGEMIEKNSTYWFEHELVQYPCHEFDLTKIKSAYDQGKLMLISGIENKDVAFIYKPNQYLAEYLGAEILDTPGAHLGFVSDYNEFAECFIDKLKSEKII